MRRLLKEYIQFLAEEYSDKDIKKNFYRGYKSPKPPEYTFYKQLVWSAYYNDALAIGMSGQKAREYAQKEADKDEQIYNQEYQRKKSLFSPKQQ